MNKFGKKIVIAGVCLAMLTGCGVSANTTAATLDGENIPYSLVNFYIRYGQSQMQSLYGAYLGDSYWTQYGADFVDSSVETIEEMFILEKHMDDYSVSLSQEEQTNIEEAAKAFVEGNDEDVLKAVTADESTVARYLTLYTIQRKMTDAIRAEADTEVSDEEAAQKTIQYAFFSTAGTETDDEGNTIDLTDEEKAALKDQAQQVLDGVKGGEELDAALTVVDEEMTSTTASYGTDDTNLDDAVKEAADALTDGQCADNVVETDGGYYVIVMQSTFDEEATENRKATIVTERQDAKYNEVVDAWKEEVKFETKDKVLDKIVFTDTYQLKETETESETETAAETTAETETMAETTADTETAAQ